MAKAKKLTKAKVKKQDKGYYFPDFDIHVAAKTEAEAKKHIKQNYGIDVDSPK